DLAVPPETAEALKRALANPAPDEMVSRARTSIDRPLSVLLDEVRSSIDYYRNQPGSAQLRRVVVTGGSAQLPGLPERLSALVGVPVEPAYMHDLLRIGDIGFAPEELPRLEPYLPASVGLALGGANVGTVIDLRPKHRSSSSKLRGGLNQKAIAAAIVGVVLLAGGTYKAHADQASASTKAKNAAAAEKKLRSQLYYEQQGPATSGGSGAASAATLKSEITNILGEDVAWTSVLSDIGVQLPPGVQLTQFAGTHTVAVAPAATATPAAPATGTAAAGTTAGTAGAAGTTPLPAAPSNDICAGLTAPDGTLTMTGIAPSVSVVSTFMDALQHDTDLTNLWMTTAKSGTTANTAGVQFTITASLGSTARGHRLETFFGEAKCK
ncbi:MAG TPA: PilN domain-containing protein, partial [Acidimicrobiia bacterium]|nr:PilN domain-containing protein [Acidimicrobiia bacterium]